LIAIAAKLVPPLSSYCVGLLELGSNLDITTSSASGLTHEITFSAAQPKPRFGGSACERKFFF
jgi:hypothetical protein